MALQVQTTFKSSVSSDLDLSTARITLRAQLAGDAVLTAGETPERLRTSGLIPKVADSFPDNTSLLCTHVECNQDSPLRIEWQADYEWTTPEPPNGGGGQGVPSTWSISMQSVKGQHQIDKDFYGLPIMTVTRESFEPPLTEEISDLAYVLSTENRPWNPTLLAMYIDSVNSDAWLGHQAGSAKIDDIQGTQQVSEDGAVKMSVQIRVIVGRAPPAANLFERNGSLWRAITKPVEYYTWHKRVMGQGYFFNKTWPGQANQKTTRIRATDDYGEPAVKPSLHQIPSDSSLSTGYGKEIKDETKAQFYAFRTKAELPFATLFNSI